MVHFLIFVIGRYAGFVSHLAAFLAGLSLVLPISFGLSCLALAIILGSLSAWCRTHTWLD